MITLSATRPSSELTSQMRRIATDVAAKYAADVDAKARFPVEAIHGLKEAGLMSAAVPKDFGGSAADMQELAAMCMELAQGCAASGMIYAMHVIQVACIARHGLTSSFCRAYLKELVDKQLLIASVTSEVGTWGDMRSSICALTPDGPRFRLEKNATTVSYGAHADDLLVTCRRNPQAPASDQILVLLRKGDFQLEQTTSWDTLGMRGTCSPGFKVTSTVPAQQVIPGPFGDSSAQTMVSYSHILWSAVWAGIAAEAVSRAAAYIRAQARHTPGVLPQPATRLAEVAVSLQAMRNNIAAMAAEFDAITVEPDGMDRLLTIGWALKMNNIKVSCSEAAPAIVHQALQIVGLGGYKNDGKYTVGRNYRDALSAPLMISNDRICNKNAWMLMVYKDE